MTEQPRSREAALEHGPCDYNTGPGSDQCPHGVYWSDAPPEQPRSQEAALFDEPCVTRVEALDVFAAVLQDYLGDEVKASDRTRIIQAAAMRLRSKQPRSQEAALLEALATVERVNVGPAHRRHLLREWAKAHAEDIAAIVARSQEAALDVERLRKAIDIHNEKEEPFAAVHCNSGDDCHLRIAQDYAALAATPPERPVAPEWLSQALNEGDGTYKP